MEICRRAGRGLIWNGELRARQPIESTSWLQPMKSVNCIPPARNCSHGLPTFLRVGATRTMIACVLINGAAIAQGPSTAAQVPDLDTCLSRLDPELDIGYDRIAARCPELAKQLDHGAWAPWLPRGWKEPGNDL